MKQKQIKNKQKIHQIIDAKEENKERGKTVQGCKARHCHMNGNKEGDREANQSTIWRKSNAR